MPRLLRCLPARECSERIGLKRESWGPRVTVSRLRVNCRSKQTVPHPRGVSALCAPSSANLHESTRRKSSRIGSNESVGRMGVRHDLGAGQTRAIRECPGSTRGSSHGPGSPSGDDPPTALATTPSGGGDVGQGRGADGSGARAASVPLRAPQDSKPPDVPQRSCRC